jgi:hypothetical protein
VGPRSKNSGLSFVGSVAGGAVYAFMYGVVTSFFWGGRRGQSFKIVPKIEQHKSLISAKQNHAKWPFFGKRDKRSFLTKFPAAGGGGFLFALEVNFTRGRDQISSSSTVFHGNLLFCGARSFVTL